MRMSKFRSGTTVLLLAFFTNGIVFASGARAAGAGATGTVGGKVVDPLGAVVPKARVTLVQREKVAGVTESDQEGNFVFSPVEVGQYLVRGKPPDSNRRKAMPCILRRIEPSVSK